ncbi:MAG: DUF559 domain-containing protein [candidate division WOR-3 bacterium]|nr:DUF559 domain-containing protein [candidate division WOR-3 bacterium]
MKRRLTPLAKVHRKNLTKAEVKLWVYLSDKKLNAKFRKQCPIGNYIVDFVSFEAGLVVEVDGSQHMESKEDKLRDAWLKSQGFKVLRFWNKEVIRNIEGVLKVIEDAISTPPPYPPPSRGRTGFVEQSGEN